MTKIIEKIAKTKSCQKCQISFDITDRDLEFYDKVSPVFAGEKYSIPTPKLCPECRQQRRLNFRNERNLYKRTCDSTGKDIVSLYDPEKPYKVYNADFWWSSDWDSLDYGRDFDFSQNFFDQFYDLQQVVPRLSIINSQSENSAYTNFSSSNKNCYYTFGMFFDEDVHYCHYGSECKDSLDSLRVSSCELCYECIDCEKSYKLFFSQDSQSCSNSWFLKNCIDCNDCFDCVNLNNKQYCFKNKQLSKQEYQDTLQSLRLEEYSNIIKMKNESIVSRLKFPHRSMVGTQNENVIGDFLYDCSNCIECFSAWKCEDCKYGYQVDEVTMGQDMNCMWYDKSEFCYECTGWTGLFDTIFTECVWMCSNVMYSGQCFNSKDLFWCIWLNNKQYCIFNKQYTKQEYEALVPRIIEKMKQDGQWWEFFPASMSPFGYNEAVVNEYFPLKKAEIIEQWFNYCDYEAPFSKVDKTIPATKLPENIENIPDDILNWAIECEITKKPFRIIPQELKFYRRHNLPVPRRHPDQRHLDRIALRNPRKLFERDCDKCWDTMQTSYSPEKPEKVYCEGCYNKEIY